MLKLIIIFIIIFVFLFIAPIVLIFCFHWQFKQYRNRLLTSYPLRVFILNTKYGYHYAFALLLKTLAEARKRKNMNKEQEMINYHLSRLASLAIKQKMIMH
jgi:hypothetical protein